MNALAVEQVGQPSDMDEGFSRALMAALPRVRAAARSLTRNPDDAADLLQDTVERAWKARANFQLGTNMVAWLCFIQRNQFYSMKRRAWRWVQMPVLAGQDGGEISMADLIPVAPRQADNMELEELREALSYLPHDMREAIQAVAVDGLTYEEAAAEFDTEVGTIKSRVSRGRDVLGLYFGMQGRGR